MRLTFQVVFLLVYATLRVMPRGFSLPNIYRPSSVITGGIIRDCPDS